MANKVKCTCGHSWSKSDSSKKDMYVCHICGKDNTMKDGGWLDKYEVPQAQGGWVERAANANLNFWEKCRMASSAGGSGGGINYDFSGGSKYKNPFEEISDIESYDRDERKKFKSTVPEGVDIKDWVAFNRDASRMSALLRNPDYAKYTDEKGVLKPEYQNIATQFDPYYLYYKPAFADKTSITPEDIMKFQQSQPEGIAGYRELVNRRYMPKQENGGYTPIAQNGIEGTMGGLTDKGFNYNGAWGGPSMAMGGSMPGTVGFTYARTQGAAPSNGPYAKKTKASAQNGASIPVIEDMGDFKDGVWVPDLKAMAKEAKRLGVKKIKTKSGSILYFNDKWEAVSADDAPSAQNGKEVEYKDLPEIKIQGINKKKRAVSDNTRINPIVTDKPIDHEIVRSTEPFTPKDNRSIFSDSRAIERINNPNADFVQDLTVDTFIDQIPYAPIVLAAKAINEGKPFTGLSELIKQPLHATGDLIINALQENPKGIDVKTLEEKIVPFARLAADAIFGNPIITQIGKQIVSSGKQKNSKSHGRNYNLPTLFEAAKSYGVDNNTFTKFIEDNWESSGGNYKKILDLANKKFPKKQNGGEMKFYQEGLDWKPRNISKQGSKIKKDDNGYWNPENWGKPVEIGSNNITMQGVYEPLLGVSDTGDTKMMYPGEDYKFDGKTVTEYPMAQQGIKQPLYVSDPNDPRLKTYQDSLYSYNVGQRMAGVLANDKNLVKVVPKSVIYKNLQAALKKHGNKLLDNSSIDAQGYKNYERIGDIMKEYQSKGNKGILPINIQPYWPDPENTVKDLVTLRGVLDAVGITDPRPPFAVNLPEWKKPEQQVVLDPSKAPKPKEKPDRFGLTTEDYIQARKTEWIPTPGNKYGDGYYRLKKDGVSYEVYTQSGGNSWVNRVTPKPKPKPSAKPEPKKQEPKVEQPVKKTEQPKPVERKQNVYQGTPVYSTGVGAGLPSSLVGFRSEAGDTTFIKPEDYERFGVPAYGKEYIESKVVKKKESGGKLSVAQKGINIPAATPADSLRIYNMQLAQNAYYDKFKNAFEKPVIESYYDDVYNNPAISSLFIGNNPSQSLVTYRGAIKDAQSNPDFWLKRIRNYHNVDNKQAMQMIGNSLAGTKAYNTDPNIIYYKDLITPQIDPAAPFSIYDKRIKPQGVIYRKPKLNVDFPGEQVETFYYDPIAVKPFSMRTPKEQEEFERKYGKPKPKSSTKPTPKKEEVKKQETKKQETKKQEPVVTRKQEPIVERKQNVYEGSPIYSPGAGSGLPSTLVGFLGSKGDTSYIKPEDYERFSVPRYGKEFIESKTTSKKKNGGWLDKYK